MGKISIFVACLCIGLLVVVIMPQIACGQQEPLWKAPIENDVRWMKLAPDGKIIVATKDGLTAYDADDGNQLWRIAALNRVYEDGFSFIGETSLAVVDQVIVDEHKEGRSQALNREYRRVVHVIDCDAGTSLWGTDQFGIHTTAGHFFIPQIDGLMLYCLDTSRAGTMKAVASADGSLIWEADDFFGRCEPELLGEYSRGKNLSGNQIPLFDSDSTFIVAMDKCTVQRRLIATGVPMWQTSIGASDPPLLSELYAPLMPDPSGELVYVPHDKTLSCLRLSDGTPLWDRPPKLDGRVQQMVCLPEGLLVKGGPGPNGKGGKYFMILLNPETGSLLWKDPLKKPVGDANFVIKDQAIVLYGGKKMYRVSIEDGSFDEFTSDIKMEYEDGPPSLARFDGGFLLTSAQELVKVDTGGNEVFHSYFKPPPGSALGELASFFGSLALTYAVHQIMLEMEQRIDDNLIYNTKGTSFYRRDVRRENPMPYVEFKFEPRKYGNSFVSDSNMYIQTFVTEKYYKYGRNHFETMPKLVKIDRRTGETLTEFSLDDGHAAYVVDEGRSRVYVVTKNDGIVALPM